jgi:hypothetical protein
MRTIPEKQVLSWLAERQLDAGHQYPERVSVRFPEDFSRFWGVPSRPEARSYFIATILRLIEPWSECLVWKPYGSWPDSVNEARTNDVVQLHLLRGLGLPLGTADAVVFAHSEKTTLVSLVFLTTIFGWGVGDDLLIIPDSGSFIVKAYHHDVIYVFCKSDKSMKAFVEAMKKEEYLLPEKVPDSTFKTPEWMKK